MIVEEHGTIRTAGPDDAAFLKQLYARGKPLAGLLDPKREFAQPTEDELRELLGTKDFQQTGFYAVEDSEGIVQGFCALRTSNTETFMGQFVYMLFDETRYESPLSDVVWRFMTNDAFLVKRLNKMMAHCLDREDALRSFLAARGFESDGIQREVLYAGGRWHNLESLTLFRATSAAREDWAGVEAL